MKKLFQVGMSFLMMSQISFAQDTAVEPQPFDLTGITERHQVDKLAATPIDQSETFVAWTLWELMNNDVFAYFEIEDMFPTPLQIKNFKRSEEYGSLENALKEQRAKLPNLEFTLNVEAPLSQYDMKKGGFNVNVPFSENPVINDDYTCNIRMCNPRGQCARQECDRNKQTSYPNAHRGFLFYEIAGRNNKKTEVSWFIKVDETNASTIENTNAKLRIIFKVGKMSTKIHKTNKSESLKLPNGYSISSKETHSMKLPLFETKIVRLEFVDSSGAVVASIPK